MNGLDAGRSGRGRGLIAARREVRAQHELALKAADQYVGVLQTRGEHADAHLAPASCRQGSVDHFQPVGTAKAPDLNDSVAQLSHALIARCI